MKVLSYSHAYSQTYVRMGIDITLLPIDGGSVVFVGGVGDMHAL